MAMLIISRNGNVAHIKDILYQGDRYYFFVEVQRKYKSERLAFRRAVVWCKRQPPKAHRKRKNVGKNESRILDNIMPVKPKITTFYEDGKKRHYVWDTGRVFKRQKNAIKNAITFAKNYYNGKIQGIQEEIQEI